MTQKHPKASSVWGIHLLISYPNGPPQLDLDTETRFRAGGVRLPSGDPGETGSIRDRTKRTAASLARGDRMLRS